MSSSALFSAQQLMGEIEAWSPPLPGLDAARCSAFGLADDAPAALDLLMQTLEALCSALAQGPVDPDGGGEQDETAAGRHRPWLQHAMMRGLTAQALARHCPLPDVGALCGIGMLADIGHLLLRHLVPALTLEAERASRQTGEALYRVERRRIGFDFAEAGAALMLHWGLPDRHAIVIGAQTQPRLAGSFRNEARLIGLASLIVDGGLITAAMADVAAQTRLARLWPEPGLSQQTLARIRAEVHAGMPAFFHDAPYGLS